MDKLLLGVDEFGQACGIGSTLAKRLIRERRVVSVKIGDRRLVPIESARAFIGELINEQVGATAP